MAAEEKEGVAQNFLSIVPAFKRSSRMEIWTFYSASPSSPTVLSRVWMSSAGSPVFGAASPEECKKFGLISEMTTHIFSTIPWYLAFAVRCLPHLRNARELDCSGRGLQDHASVYGCSGTLSHVFYVNLDSGLVSLALKVWSLFPRAPCIWHSLQISNFLREGDLDGRRELAVGRAWAYDLHSGCSCAQARARAWEYFLRVLRTGAGPGVTSTRTRPPLFGACTAAYG